MACTPLARAAVVSLAVLYTSASAAEEPAQTDRPLLASEPITSPVAVLAPALPDRWGDLMFLELQQWTQEYEEWKAWFVRWHNRREPGWFSRPRPRRQPPMPPAWLAGTCAGLLDDAGPLAEGCRDWREWARADLTVLATEQIAQERMELERPQKSSWWQHIHVDALWVMTQTGSNAFGVAGMHATVPVSERAQVFAAPGVILMRLPTGDAGRGWRAAMDWGFSYKVWDFRLPLTHRPSTLHFNAVRVWILGNNQMPLERDLYLAGFSVSFRRR